MAISLLPGINDQAIEHPLLQVVLEEILANNLLVPLSKIIPKTHAEIFPLFHLPKHEMEVRVQQLQQIRLGIENVGLLHSLYHLHRAPCLPSDLEYLLTRRLYLVRSLLLIKRMDFPGMLLALLFILNPLMNSIVRAPQDFTPRKRVNSRTRDPSPTPSTRSRNIPSKSENKSNGPEANAQRRDQNARISYFDPANQATLDRLILSADTQIDGEGEEENAQATLTNVEEMIEGYEWTGDDVIGRKTAKGAVDLIEARLLDELMALEKVSTYPIAH